MNVRVKIVDNRLNELSGQLRRLASRAVREELMAITKDVKMDMAQTKSGGLYLRSKTGAPHQASAPGEAPAIDSGALVNSIQTELVSATAERAEVQVFTNMKYAPPLEYGTAHIEARPFMRPAADENEDEIGEAARMVLKQLIEEAAG